MGDARIQPTPVRIIEWPGFGRIWVKDESLCPTGTFKDRLSSRLEESLERTGLLTPETAIGSITLGNTLASLASTFLRRPEEERPSVFGVFPAGFGARTIGPDTAGRSMRGADLLARLERLGARVIEHPLEERYLDGASMQRLAEQVGVRFRQFVDVTNGIDAPAYRIILEEALPEIGPAPLDYVIVPVGAGILFQEAVQLLRERGHHAVVLGVSVLSGNSIADKLFGYYSPYYDDLRKRAVAQYAPGSSDRVELVDDGAISEALGVLRAIGVDAEPSAAAAFAALSRLPAGSNVLVVNTGNGIPWGHGPR
jgi:cysteine synthase